MGVPNADCNFGTLKMDTWGEKRGTVTPIPGISWVWYEGLSYPHTLDIMVKGEMKKSIPFTFMV